MRALNWESNKRLGGDEKLGDLGRGTPKKGVFLQGNKILQQGFMFINLVAFISSGKSPKWRKKKENTGLLLYDIRMVRIMNPMLRSKNLVVPNFIYRGCKKGTRVRFRGEEDQILWGKPKDMGV